MACPFISCCPHSSRENFLSPEQPPWENDASLPGCQASLQSPKEQGWEEGSG